MLPCTARRPRLAKKIFQSLEVVLSALAHQATSKLADATRAFERGAQTQQPGGRSRLSLLPSEECTTDALDDSLDVLASAPPFVKKSVLEACAACVLADEKVTVREFELLRAIADSLDCPIPPIVSCAIGSRHTTASASRTGCCRATTTYATPSSMRRRAYAVCAAAPRVVDRA